MPIAAHHLAARSAWTDVRDQFIFFDTESHDFKLLKQIREFKRSGGDIFEKEAKCQRWLSGQCGENRHSEAFENPGFRLALAIASLPGMTINSANFGSDTTGSCLLRRLADSFALQERFETFARRV